MTIDQLRQMWSSVAPAWARHTDFIEARAAALTERMLAFCAPQPGERVLELACGPGGLGLAAAPLVRPGGEVVLSDLAPEMTDLARDRAAALGLDHVSARSLDLDHVEEPAASFDVVLCREGLMFAPDPARAAGEIRRVLRPGGRTAIAVWGPRARNPWLGVVLDSLSAQLGRPMPPPGVPGPFSLDDAGHLHALLAGSGLSSVDVSEVEVPLRTASFDEWWDRTTTLAGPLSTILRSLPDGAVAGLRERARAAIEPYRDGSGLAFPGVTLLATAKTP